MTDETQAAAAQDTTAATQADAAQSESSLPTPDAVTPPTEADQQEEGAKTGDKAKAEGEGKETDDKDKAAGAPEEYADFTVPDGVEMDADVLTEFKGIAKELGISQETAQKFIDLQAGMETKRAEALQQALADQSQQWMDQVKNDKEIGGEQYDSTVKLATKTIEAFGSPELRAVLNDSGLGNHPELVKFCHRIGKAMSEDGLVMGGSQEGGEKDIASRLWGQQSN